MLKRTHDSDQEPDVVIQAGHAVKRCVCVRAKIRCVCARAKICGMTVARSQVPASMTSTSCIWRRRAPTYD
eukprot:6092400-Amphidinium_carterae.1